MRSIQSSRVISILLIFIIGALVLQYFFFTGSGKTRELSRLLKRKNEENRVLSSKLHEKWKESKCDEESGKSIFLNQMDSSIQDLNLISGSDLFNNQNFDPTILANCKSYSEHPPNVQGGIFKILGDCILPPKKLEKPRYVMVTYADGCCYETQKSIEKRAYEVGFHQVYSYGFKDLEDDFVNRHEDIFALKRGAGYWIWKAGAIQKAMSLEPISEDVYIMYMDVDANFKDDIDIGDLFEDMRKRQIDIMLFEFQELNYKWTKRDAFVLMDADNEEFALDHQTWASFQGYRNTYWSRFFVRQWEKYMGDERILTDMNNTQKLPNFEGFEDHRHDQSVLSILVKKYGVIPFHYLHHHKYWIVGWSHE